MYGNCRRHTTTPGNTRPVSPGPLLVALCIGLGSTPATGLTAQPTVVVRDSIVLEESAEDYLALPGAVAPDGVGGYLVTDFGQPRVFHYFGDGRLMQRYGREGDGPGEFRAASLTLTRGDEHVLVLSWQPFAAQLFERSTGRFVERFPLRGNTESALLDSGGLWISEPHYATRSAVRRLQLGDDEAVPVVRLPDEYTFGSPVGGMFHAVPFTKWADTLLVGFQPLPYLIVTDTAGKEVDRFEIPAVHRRGTPADPESAIEKAFVDGPYFHVFAVLSSTVGVHRRGDGSLLVVHFDLQRADEPPLGREAFVTVIEESRTRACADGEILLGPKSNPAIGFEGDMILVLEQVPRGMDAVPVLRRITVETDQCDWVPLGR